MMRERYCTDVVTTAGKIADEIRASTKHKNEILKEKVINWLMEHEDQIYARSVSVFGSYAYETALPSSDFDVHVNLMPGCNLEQSMTRLWSLAANTDFIELPPKKPKNGWDTLSCNFFGAPVDVRLVDCTKAPNHITTERLKDMMKARPQPVKDGKSAPRQG